MYLDTEGAIDVSAVILPSNFIDGYVFVAPGQIARMFNIVSGK